MNKQVDINHRDAKPTGLALLREPFPANQISKLPKPTKKQTEEVRADFKRGIRCVLCGQWHHKDVVHLDYVGHAALTDRLLDCDPEWNWEPVAFDEKGAPAVDQAGGMWIKLTVCGVTRLGYGDADGKQGGNAVKERIGDALRNAAMRFGAALDLWHKGELHVDDVDITPKDDRQLSETDAIASHEWEVKSTIRSIQAECSLDDLKMGFRSIYRTNRKVADDPRVIAAKEAKKAELSKPDLAKELADGIPY